MAALTEAQRKLYELLLEGRTLSFHDDWHSDSSWGGTFVVHPHIDNYGVQPRTVVALVDAGLIRSKGKSHGIEDFVLAAPALSDTERKGEADE